MKWNKPNIDTKAAAASFKASLQTITTRNGAYSAAAIVIVVVIAVVINLICGSLPATIKQLDISSNKIYEISDKLGYESAFYFSRVFKKVEGVSPRDYINRT